MNLHIHIYVSQRHGLDSSIAQLDDGSLAGWCIRQVLSSCHYLVILQALLCIFQLRSSSCASHHDDISQHLCSCFAKPLCQIQWILSIDILSLDAHPCVDMLRSSACACMVGQLQLEMSQVLN